MAKPRIHFEQVPLEVVKKIVEEEVVQQKDTDEPVPKIGKTRLRGEKS